MIDPHHEISGQSKRRELPQSFTIPRGFLIFMIMASGWSLYAMLRHMSTRFEVPRHFVISFAVFGRAGVFVDLCIYLYVAWLGFLFAKLARDWVERAWVAFGIAPILINPIKMLIPRYSHAVWWAEVFLGLMFFLATIAMFLNWKPRPTLSRCRTRFGRVPEPPHAPEL